MSRSRIVLSLALAALGAAAAPSALLAVQGGSTPTEEEAALAARLESPVSPGYFCGGTLISPHHVLTAAHCVDPVDRGYGPSGDGHVLVDAQGQVGALRWDGATGCFYAAGASGATGGASGHLTVWRLDEDGVDDALVTVFAGVERSQATDLAVLADGVVAVGWARREGRTVTLVAAYAAEPGLARLWAPWPADDGGGDLGFASEPGRLTAVCASADGESVVVGGQAAAEAGQTRLLRRFAFTGDLDPAFAPPAAEGEVVDLGTAGANVVALELRPGGARHLVVYGPTGAVVATRALDFAADRLLVDGGRVVVAGTSTATTPAFLVARYTLPALALDTAFASGGRDTIATAWPMRLRDLARDPQGRLLLAGDALDGASMILLVRLDGLGRRDAGFGQGGVALVRGHTRGAAQAVASGGGQLLTVGDSSQGLVATRFVADGVLPLTARVGDAERDVTTIARHPDPAVDAAILFVDEPLASPSLPANATAFVTDVLPGPLDGRVGATVRCLGNGGTSPAAPVLRGADGELDQLDPRHLWVVQGDAGRTVPGDSGGGCWAELDGARRLVGIVSGDGPPPARAWAPAAEQARLARTDELLTWIAGVIGP